jgi:multiple sugar transport system permease protein
MSARRKSAVSRLLIALAVIAFVAFSLFPVYYMLLTSLKPNALLLEQPPRFWFTATLDNYVKLLREGDFPRYYLNSLIVAGVSTGLAVLLGSMMAFALAHIPFRRQGAAMFLILVPRSFPPVTTILPVFFAVRTLGMMDQLSTLILFETAVRIPLVVWIMRGFMRSVPTELIEAALLDGASLPQCFFRIVAPLAVTGMIAVGIICFIDTWNAFLVPLVLTNLRAVTAPVGLMSYTETDEQVVWGLIAAGGILTILPILIFAFGLNRFLLQGLTSGALKG